MEEVLARLEGLETRMAALENTVSPVNANEVIREMNAILGKSPMSRANNTRRVNPGVKNWKNMERRSRKNIEKEIDPKRSAAISAWQQHVNMTLKNMRKTDPDATRREAMEKAKTTWKGK
jgi:hypothetical protein